MKTRLFTDKNIKRIGNFVDDTISTNTLIQDFQFIVILLNAFASSFLEYIITFDLISFEIQSDKNQSLVLVILSP